MAAENGEDSAAILEEYGGKATRPLDVARALGVQPSSGPFRMLCGSAIAYGLTNSGYNSAEIALFRIETLTSSQTAKLTKQTNLPFQKALASRRIPIHYGPAELDEDLRTLRRHCDLSVQL